MGQGQDRAARRDEDAVEVASLERRNRDTGNAERVRFLVAEFGGKLLMSARIWFRVKPTGPDDDGWRPSKIGFSVREHEIGEVLSGLEQYRDMVANRPVPETPEPPDRPGRRTRESRRDQPPTRRPPHPGHRAARPALLPAVEPESPEVEDEFAEYRRHPKRGGRP